MIYDGIKYIYGIFVLWVRICFVLNFMLEIGCLDGDKKTVKNLDDQDQYIWMKNAFEGKQMYEKPDGIQVIQQHLKSLKPSKQIYDSSDTKWIYKFEEGINI